MPLGTYRDVVVLGVCGHGAGSDLVHRQKRLSSCGFSTSVAVADFDGDGVADLAVGNDEFNSISVLRGNGDGTFAASVNYPTSRPTSVAVGDFNRDGAPDLAVANWSANTVSVLLGRNDGT